MCQMRPGPKKRAEPVIIDLASDPEEARHKKRIPRPSTSADPEVIVVSDDSPSTNRVLPRGGEPILILDSPERTPPRALTPVAARTSEVIVLDDSPRETITILDSPEIFPTIMHDPPPGPSSGISTAEPAHAILPVSDIEPNIDIDLPTMDVDPDVPPVSAMFQQMTVSESPAPPPRPQGGTLVPAWVRARYQASGQTAMWEQVVEKQNRSSAPFSRQKPKFLKSNTREPTIAHRWTDPSTGKQLCLYEQFPKNRVPVYLSWL
ncbi:hypothetical protein C8J57DRAFT_1214593 [Mycena rebaudengoi]|nr:hypothetical protein C8J57DRAFT_1214593 [Mycena rebaudengoi]